MTNSQRLATVRDRLIHWMADHVNRDDTDLAGQAGTSPIKRESILIRDGFYCGRRFDLGTHRAVWFLEEDEVKIYGGEGKLLGVLNSQQIGAAAEEPSAERQIIRLPQAESQPASDNSSQEDQGDQEIRRAA